MKGEGLYEKKDTDAVDRTGILVFRGAMPSPPARQLIRAFGCMGEAL
jgi:hypothetical protein